MDLLFYLCVYMCFCECWLLCAGTHGDLKKGTRSSLTGVTDVSEPDKGAGN